MADRGGWRRALGALGDLIGGVRLKPYDWVVFVVAILVVVAFSLLALDRTGTASSVLVRTDEGDFIYPLDRDATFEVDGPLGVSIIEIADGSVRFVDSPCRDRICVAAGELSEAGQWAACLPNRVFVSVTGDTGEREVDASTF